MSEITERITAIEDEINKCFSCDLPIDPKSVKALQELRLARVNELCATHAQRLAIMQEKTREMTTKLSSLNLNGKPDAREKLLDEQSKYDAAAVHWVNSESVPWDESEASSIAAGILIIAASLS